MRKRGPQVKSPVKKERASKRRTDPDAAGGPEEPDEVVPPSDAANSQQPSPPVDDRTFSRRRIARLQERIEEIEEDLRAREESRDQGHTPTVQYVAAFLATGLGLVLLFVGPQLGLRDESSLIAAITLGAVLPWVAYAISRQADERTYKLREELSQRTRELETLERHERSAVDRLVDMNVSNLEKYYHLVSSHTGRSFVAALASGIAGFLLLVIGLALSFRAAETTRLSGFVTAGCGVVIQFISAVFFVLYRRTVAELKTYHERLLRVQNTLIAFSYVDGIAEKSERSKTLASMIAALVNPTPASPLEAAVPEGPKQRRLRG